MADNNYNAVKPIEGLHTITGLTPATRREQRKRKQNPQHTEQEQQDESLEQQNKTDTPADTDDHSIDYCA